MKLTLFLVLITGTLVLCIFPSSQGKVTKYHADGIESILSSVNPPAAKTGAPGETTCTSCHSGTAQAAAGIIDVTFSGVGNEYIVEQAYTITISIATGTKNGFEMTILNGSNTKAGTFTAGTNTSITNSGGKQYIRQSVSASIMSWSFTWTAPTTDMGDLTMYYTFNKSNAANNSGGDVIYVGQFNIASAAFNTITDYEKEDAAYSVFYNSEHNELNLNYSLGQESKVVLSIQDLSGRLIQQTDFGNQADGIHAEKITLDHEPPAGIYIVSVFVNNNVYNRKVAIQ